MIKLCTAGIRICGLMYAAFLIATIFIYMFGVAGAATPQNVTLTARNDSASLPWDDLRKSVSETAVITFFSFLVITALTGLVLYFARSKSSDAIRHENIVSKMSDMLIDALSKNTIALDKLGSKLDSEREALQDHPCLLLDSEHRAIVLRAIADTNKENNVK